MGHPTNPQGLWRDHRGVGRRPDGRVGDAEVTVTAGIFATTMTAAIFAAAITIATTSTIINPASITTPTTTTTFTSARFPPEAPPRPSDPDVAALMDGFDTSIGRSEGLAVSSRGAFKRDRDTFFWSLFTDKFGSNPNTPYMWNSLPLLGFLLPSPMVGCLKF